MDYTRIIRCGIYKENQIVEIERYMYDSKFNKTHMLYDDATLKEIVAEWYVRTIHGHYIMIGNTRPLVTKEEYRYVKIKKILRNAC